MVDKPVWGRRAAHLRCGPRAFSASELSTAGWPAPRRLRTTGCQGAPVLGMATPWRRAVPAPG